VGRGRPAQMSRQVILEPVRNRVRADARTQGWAQPRYRREQDEEARLRGGRLEYLFYKLLKTYKDSGQIDDVIWNGRVDDFGIMYPALGGKEGYPDVYFFIKNNVYVLELTTIRANAMQWSAEGASVHDHIMNLQKKIGTQYSTHGIFSAPTIAPRVEEMFKHIATKEKIPHHTISIEDLIKQFKSLPSIFS
jgi:hypothetical protein